MTESIIIVAAGVMFGLYALPSRYTKGYEYENIWFIFFSITFVILPTIVALCFAESFIPTLKLIPTDVLCTVAAASFLWGAGIQFWSKAINFIGIALSFTIFIGSVILFSSVILYIIDDFPPSDSYYLSSLGFITTLVGMFIASRIRRTKENNESLHISWGVAFSLLGGLLATSILLAYRVGFSSFETIPTDANTPIVVILCISYLAGALYAVPYFTIKLFRNGSWGNFRNNTSRNITMITIMSLLFFISVAAFAYDAY